MGGSAGGAGGGSAGSAITEGGTFQPGNTNKFYSRMWVWFAPDIPKAATGDFHTGFMMGGGKNNTADVTADMGMIGSDQQYLGYSIRH